MAAHEPAAELEEQSVEGLLHIATRGETTWLYNAGTGEKTPLGITPGELATLRYDNGVGVVSLSCDGKTEEVPHTEILEKALCGTADGDEGDLVIAGAMQEKRSTVLMRVTHRPFSVKEGDTALYTTLTYHFEVGVRPTYSRIWWSLPHLVQYCVMGKIASAYIKEKT